jgi:hypothetical protein
MVTRTPTMPRHDSMYEYCCKYDTSYYNWIPSGEEIQRYGKYYIGKIFPVQDPSFEVDRKESYLAANNHVYLQVQWGDYYPRAYLREEEIYTEVYLVYQLQYEGKDKVYFSLGKVFRSYEQAQNYLEQRIEKVN